MSLSKHLQEPVFLSAALGRGPQALKQALLDRGEQWFTRNAGESGVIEENLRRFSIDPSPALIAGIRHHILLHYFEKFLPLCGDDAWYADYLADRVDGEDALRELARYRRNNTSVILAGAHFGAVEMIAPWLSLKNIPVAPVLRFTTPEFSRKAKTRAAAMQESGRFGAITFIEIGDPDRPAALDMAAALRRQDVLVSMFDEETPYSIPVSLFGKKIRGGAGLDRMLKFSRVPTVLCSAFMVRTGEDRCRLVLREISDGSMQGLYDALADVLKHELVQWYFLHEEIPFIP
jgi:lauroyl/myristoyl acyltransferase